MTYEMVIPENPKRDLIRNDGVIFEWVEKAQQYRKSGMTYPDYTWEYMISNGQRWKFEDYEPPAAVGDVVYVDLKSGFSSSEKDRYIRVFDGTQWNEYQVFTEPFKLVPCGKAPHNSGLDWKKAE